MRLFILLVLIMLLHSCMDDIHPPGKPLIAFDFNGHITNHGLSAVSINGDALVSYSYGQKDTSLDLTASAKYRKPVTIRYNQTFSLKDYSGFTVSVWVQKATGDEEEYCILSQQQIKNKHLLGWELKAEKCGTWSWCFKDSIQSWTYMPTVTRQPINDKQ